MTGTFLKAPDGVENFSLDWSNQLPIGATITAVVHTVRSTDANKPTIQTEQYTDTTTAVRLAGGQHGRTYEVEAKATLDNGETLPRSFTVRCHAA